MDKIRRLCYESFNVLLWDFVGLNLSSLWIVSNVISVASCETAITEHTLTCLSCHILILFDGLWALGLLCCPWCWEEVATSHIGWLSRKNFTDNRNRLIGNCYYVLLEMHVCNYYYFLTIGKKKYHPLTKAKQEFALFCISNSNDAIDQTRFNGSSDFTQPFSALIICFLTWFHWWT